MNSWNTEPSQTYSGTSRKWVGPTQHFRLHRLTRKQTGHGHAPIKVKVKSSRYKPRVAQRVPGGLGSQISLHLAREGGEDVSLTHRLPLPPGMFLVLIFTRGWVDPRAMVRSEGTMSLKNPVTPPGIDPGTVHLGAQRLKHYATAGPTHAPLPRKKDLTQDHSVRVVKNRKGLGPQRLLLINSFTCCQNAFQSHVSPVPSLNHKTPTYTRNITPITTDKYLNQMHHK
jgi:hypothetical protein